MTLVFIPRVLTSAIIVFKLKQQSQRCLLRIGHLKAKKQNYAKEKSVHLKNTNIVTHLNK